MPLIYNHPTSNPPSQLRIYSPPMLSPPHPVPLDHLFNMFPIPNEAHIAANPNVYPFQAPTTWSHARTPFVLLFCEIMAAIEHLHPDTPALILLCYVWAEPATRDILLLQEHPITDNWERFCQSIPNLFPNRELLSVQSAHALTSSFRDRVLQHAQDDDTYHSLMSRFRAAFDVSAVHSLHHLLYPHPEIFSRFDNVLNDIFRRAYHTISNLEDDIEDARNSLHDIQSLTDILPALTHASPRPEVRTRINRVTDDAAQAHRRIQADLCEILRIIDMSRNMAEVLRAQLPAPPTGTPHDPIVITDN